MKKLVYSVVCEQFDNPDVGNYTGYGIKLTTLEDEIVISDVFTNHEKIVNLVNLFNVCELSPIHISDVIEDALACV